MAEGIQAARDEAILRAGRSRIHRLRVVARVAVPAALIAVATGWWFVGIGFPCVPIGLGVFALVGGLLFLSSRCPRCGDRLFVGGGAGAGGSVLGIHPGRRTCSHCDLSLDPDPEA